MILIGYCFLLVFIFNFFPNCILTNPGLTANFFLKMADFSERIHDEILEWRIPNANRLKVDQAYVRELVGTSRALELHLNDTALGKLNVVLSLEQCCDFCTEGGYTAVCSNPEHLNGRRLYLVFEAKENLSTVLRVLAVKLHVDLRDRTIPRPEGGASPNEKYPLIIYNDQSIERTKLMFPLFSMNHASNISLTEDNEMEILASIFIFKAPEDPIEKRSRQLEEQFKEQVLQSPHHGLLSYLEAIPPDFQFIANDGTPVPAHSIILKARSTVMAILLADNSNSEELQTRRMVLPVSLMSVNWIYHFFRTGDVSAFKLGPVGAQDDKPSVEELLFLARKFGFQDLLVYFDKTIRWQISEENLEYVLGLSERFELIRTRVFALSIQHNQVWVAHH